VGTALVYEDGEVVSVERCGCPQGTIVEVSNLFATTPARKQFLKTEATEFAHVNRVVTQYALANPDVAVSLTHDGRETFATSGQGDRRSAVLSVYGREVAEAMVPVDARGEADGPPGDADGPLDAVSGLVSHPETNRSTREYVSTFVNGRYVRSETVREAVLDAYGGQLAGDRFPFAVLYLDVPGDTVDVNVHPRKMAVRFGEPDAVRRQVRAAVREALLDAGLLRSSAPRGRSKADETAVAPEREDAAGDVATGSDSEGDVRSEDEGDGERDVPSADERDGDATGDEGRTTGGSTGNEGVDEVVRGNHTPERRRRFDTSENGDETSVSTGRGSEGGGADAGETDAATDSTGAGEEVGEPQHPGGDGTAGVRGHDERADRDPHAVVGAADQRTLDGDTVDTAPGFETLPPLRVLGQFRDTYVVCETPEGLVLVDQHAADERVNYERLREAFAGDVTAQTLAEPVTLSVTAGEAAALDAHRDALASLGFHATLADDRTVSVRGVPAVFSETLAPEHLRDLLASFVERDPADTVDALADAFLADLACHPSVTGNTSLTEGSVLALLRALDDCENPYACPHGRPVLVRFDDADVEARFERDYPGHDG
jgi:DNA mismatch repair protein MutL